MVSDCEIRHVEMSSLQPSATVFMLCRKIGKGTVRSGKFAENTVSRVSGAVCLCWIGSPPISLSIYVSLTRSLAYYYCSAIAKLIINIELSSNILM